MNTNNMSYNVTTDPAISNWIKTYYESGLLDVRKRLPWEQEGYHGNKITSVVFISLHSIVSRNSQILTNKYLK